MPLPRWLAQMNKRTFNKLELKRGRRPVLTHVGRSSGRTFHTPLDAHAVDGGYIFIPNYGPESDWVKNILAAGEARLRVGGDEFSLVNPRLVSKEDAVAQLPATSKPPPDSFKLTQFLRMDVAG